jgi:IMP dehydrogenase
MSNTAMKQFFDSASAQGLMLTYDDVRARTLYSDVTPTDTDIDLSTRISRRVRLKMPIVSSPMDTVTTAEMAIAMAEAGGLGVIHRALLPEVQAKEVGRVKNRLNGRVETPITVRADMTVAAALDMRDGKKFPFHTFPVVDSAGKMLGLLTRNDFEFCVDPSARVTEIMTPLHYLKTGQEGMTAQEAYVLMMQHKKKVLPLIKADGTLAQMYLLSDVNRILSQKFDHNVDRNGQLVAAAAVGAGKDALQRAELLARKKCDIFHIDTAHGDSKNVLETIKLLKAAYSDVDVIAGNVSSGESAKRLAEAGADGIMVGQGPGSICTTRIIAGIGVPQVSAVYECVEAVRGLDVPVCADGGINSSGDMVIALAVGASSVMLGRLLAGAEEAPGETRFHNGMQIKDYRGMGSLGAMRDNASSRERYGQGGATPAKLVPEGIEGIVPYKGSVRSVLDQYVGGIRAGMGYNGARTLSELSERAQLFRITNAGLNESHPHDVVITGESPNYHGRS